MDFKSFSFGVVTLLAVVTVSTLFAEEKTDSCRSLPEFSGPYASGPFVVSTYHVTGTPGSTRVITLNWPDDLKVPLSGVSPGRTDSAEEAMGFDFNNGMSLPDPETGERFELPGFKLSIRGVDKLPLYSRMRIVGGGGIGELLRSNEGHTYMSAGGFDILTDPSPEGWIQFAYPDSHQRAGSRDHWLRGDPVPGGVDLLLSCQRGQEGQYTQCRVYGRVEPVNYDFFFDAVSVNYVDQMNNFAEAFVACLLEGFSDG
jgi:hypothetical protein